MKIYFTLFFILISVNLFAQDKKDSLQILDENFREFEYGNVILISKTLLQNKNKFSDNELIDIYLMKGISHFSLQEDLSAAKSFREILRIDSTYKLNASKISPKIITFYNEVKDNYITELKRETEQKNVIIDTVFVTKNIPDLKTAEELKSAAIRNLIIPGWGQIYKGDNTKGWMLAALGTASLGSSIYFIFDSKNKEQNYLTETNQALIDDAYDEYNFSYNMKNISLLTFAVTWIYAQLDLLLFSDSFDIKNQNYKFTPNIYLNSLTGINISYKINF